MSALSPWDVLGWLIVAVVAVPLAWAGWKILRNVSAVLIQNARRYYQHLRTRATPPAPGQTWLQKSMMGGDDYLRIDRIADNGRIVINSGNASWSDSPVEWAQRVKSRRLVLRGQR